MPNSTYVGDFLAGRQNIAVLRRFFTALKLYRLLGEERISEINTLKNINGISEEAAFSARFISDYIFNNILNEANNSGSRYDDHNRLRVSEELVKFVDKREKERRIRVKRNKRLGSKSTFEPPYYDYEVLRIARFVVEYLDRYRLLLYINHRTPAELVQRYIKDEQQHIHPLLARRFRKKHGKSNINSQSR
jgi:hypothetical protein